MDLGSAAAPSSATTPRAPTKVLKRAGQVRQPPTRKRVTPRDTSPWSRSPGQKVPLDVNYGPKRHGFPPRYQDTALDGSSRLRFCEIDEEVSPAASVDVLARVRAGVPFRMRGVQTDPGAECPFACFPEGKVVPPVTAACQRAGLLHTRLPIATPHHNGQGETSHGKAVVEGSRRFPVRQPAELVALLPRRTQVWNVERPPHALGRILATAAARPARRPTFRRGLSPAPARRPTPALLRSYSGWLADGAARTRKKCYRCL